MENIEIKIIPKENILTVLPLMQIINDYTDEEVLKNRLIDMSNQHYKCVGMFYNEELIGIAGLWILTRHYAGKLLEPDHVIIKEAYRNKGLGKKMFNWIHKFAQSIGCDGIELNTYIANTKSHKFYEDLNYKKTRISLPEKILKFFYKTLV